MLLPKEELEKLAVMHPQIAEYLEKHPPENVNSGGLEAMRATMTKMDTDMAKKLGPAPPGTEFYHEIPMRDGYMSSLKIQKPADGPPGPLVALCFGGGFVAGSGEQFLETGRALTHLLGATVVSIAYRLAPEYKFPFGQYDAWDSMKWIADNATGSLLQADPAKGFIMGGVSAGGGIASALTRMFQDEPLAHPLTGQWLCIPTIMDAESCPAKYKDYYISSTADFGSFLSKKGRDWLRSLVEPDPTSALRYAPLSKTPISGQPRTYIQVDGMDPLRDDGLVYEEMLKEGGVTTKMDVYPGCPHGHFAGFAGLEITNRANIDTVVGLGWLLRNELSRDVVARQLGV